MSASSIRIFSVNTSFVLKNKRIIIKWIIDSIKNEHKNPGTINIVFCSDSYLLKLNKQYLNHDTYTDILTFDYSKDFRGDISGDIYISIDTVKRNAQLFLQTVNKETLRVVIHGIMHICGYTDKTQKEKATMTQKENQYIAEFQQKNNCST